MKVKVVGVLSIVLLMLCSNLKGQQVEKFQTMYIFNISKYIEWPQSSIGNNYVIGVLSKKSKIIPELNKLASSKKLFNRTIQIEVYNSVSEIGTCNILFVPKSEKVDDIVDVALKKNILIITEKKGEIENGSAINFLLVNNKLYFEVDVKQINSCGLKMDNSLKTLAYKVH